MYVCMEGKVEMCFCVEECVYGEANKSIRLAVGSHYLSSVIVIPCTVAGVVIKMHQAGHLLGLGTSHRSVYGE